MNTAKTWLLAGLAGIPLLLPVVLAQPAHPVEPPVGKVVWWGQEIFRPGSYPEHTNGVVECDNEVLSNIVGIAAGPMEALVLKNDGTVKAFGHGPYGWNAVPPGLSNVASIAGAGSSCWAVKRDGTVARWGDNDRDDSNIVAGLSNVTAIAWAGYRSYLAVLRDGTVSGFRLGEGGTTNDAAAEPAIRAVRVQGQVLSNVVAIASSYEPVVLKKDGTVFRLAYWAPGTPRPEPEATKVDEGTLAIDFGGEFWKTPYDYTSANPVSYNGHPLSNVTAVAEGGPQALALRNDGTVVTWGAAYPGESGPPEGLSKVTAIAAAEHLGMALKTDGTVTAWGDNSSSQTSVPPGLTNVVAIAAGAEFGLALTTGSVPSSVFIYPHGRLEEMERQADLIFKGRVISTVSATNTSFPPWGKPHATRFSLISLLKGHVQTNELVFWHNTGEPMAWGGGRPPSSHQFEPGNSYLVFAAGLDKPDYLYTAPVDALKRPNEFRQLRNDGVMRTLDARPVNGRGVKEAHWLELGLLLNDTTASNQLYAIDTLDRSSLAGRHDDQWSRSGDFNRQVVLSALLPLVSNRNEQVATRAISCFATESRAAVSLASFSPALIQVANESVYPACRLAAISALSATADAAVSRSLSQLLTNADESIRVGSVRLLPRFPAGFAEPALRERARDESANVRSVVADVIGDQHYDRLLPTLARLFADPVGRDKLIEPLTLDYLQAGQRWDNIGDVHTSAGFALVQFAPDQVGGILRSNLIDSGFHINFVSKLAEQDPEPWLPELVSILEERLKHVDQILKLPENDPRRYTDTLNQRVLIGTYAKCWEDVRKYLLKLPPERLSSGEMDGYMDLLEKSVQPVPGMSVHEAYPLYELYWTKKLMKRASEVRRKYDKTDGWWFDDFEQHHPPATSP